VGAAHCWWGKVGVVSLFFIANSLKSGRDVFLWLVSTVYSAILPYVILTIIMSGVSIGIMHTRANINEADFIEYSNVQMAANVIAELSGNEANRLIRKISKINRRIERARIYLSTPELHRLWNFNLEVFARLPKNRNGMMFRYATLNR
jgi:hypothetical protein